MCVCSTTRTRSNIPLTILPKRSIFFMTTKINDYLDRIGVYDELRVSLIVPSPHALRDASTDIKELMDSIRAHGLLEPVIARPSGEKFELVAGHRRFEACKRLRLKKISTIVT